jgi:alpha-mannosidase
MIAAAHRTADLEGSPKVRIGTAANFFAQAQAEYSSLPVWVGEMYLELHRGTYTSQAKTKRGNRRSEHLLREAELWCSTASVRTAGAFDYPAAELKRLWHLVLLQQFHDILPGSSIAWVHQDAERNYAAISDALETIIAGAARAALGEGNREFLLNATPHERSGVPALAAAEPVRSGRPVMAAESDGGYILDNGVIRAVLDSNGLLRSLVDHASGREAIAPGQFGNHLELHRDTPNEWDAWDIDEFYRRNVSSLTEAHSVTLERGGGDAVVVVERLVGASAITQRISLEAGSASLGILTSVDWQEREKLLKIGFPLDVRADRSASETQFGHVFRPTHTNTSWEAARFEICAHRWIHVGEPGYGVAISNASSYGHDVTRTVRDDGGTTTTVRTSLLRAPKYPDPDADRGRHELLVTIRPGAAIADAVEEGYRTNLAPRMVKGARPLSPLFTVSDQGIVVEAVKLAEDGSGDVIVRLYESLGERSEGVVTANFETSEAHAVDLLERPAEAPGVDVGRDSAKLALRPFQLVTLRFAR